MESIAKRTRVHTDSLYGSIAVKSYIFSTNINFTQTSDMRSAIWNFRSRKADVWKVRCLIFPSYRTRTSQLPKLLVLAFYWTWSFSARKTGTHLCSREWFNAAAGAPEKAPGFTVRAVNNEMACACGYRNQHGCLECKTRRDRVVMLVAKITWSLLLQQVAVITWYECVSIDSWYTDVIQSVHVILYSLQVQRHNTINATWFLILGAFYI